MMLRRTLRYARRKTREREKRSATDAQRHLDADFGRLLGRLVGLGEQRLVDALPLLKVRPKLRQARLEARRELVDAGEGLV